MNDPQAGMPPGSQSPYPPYLPSQQGQIPPPLDTEPVPEPGRAAEAAQKSGRPSRQALIIAAVIIVVLLVAVYLIGGLTEFLGIGVLFVPLALLAVLAYAGVRNMTAMVFAYIMLGMTALGIIFYSLTNLILGYVKDWDKLNAVLSGGAVTSSSSLQGVFDPGAGAGLLLATLLYFVSALVGAAMLFRPVRVLASKIMPIDPDNFVHKIALSILAVIFISSFVPLLVLGGRPPLLNLVNGTGTSVGGQSISIQPLDPVYQLIWTIPAVFLVAGWPVARKFPEMLKRLGLVRPTTKQVLFGLGFGLVLVAASTFVIDPGVTWLWHTMGWQTTDLAVFSKLLSNLTTPVGALIIGVTAGLGEELAVRGLLQPRIGLIASNLVFTGFHAFQYGADALLSVFIVGMILGLVRARTNTTTSAIVHGMYDFTSVMLTVLFGGS